jgi:ABC-type transport system substrate-binding protein
MEHYRNDLARIGVAMTVEPVEWAVMVTRMEEKDFEAYTGGWVLGWENDPYQIWHSSQADEPRSSNRVGFRNPEADRIIEQVRETFDDAERAVLLQQFHSLLYEEQPYTFFFAGREIGAWRSNLQGVNFSVMRPFDSSMNWYFAAP